MAANPKSMHQIKQIIELQINGKGIRETERLTGIARKTIRFYLRRIKAVGISGEELLALDPESLQQLLYREDIPLWAVDERRRIMSSQLEYFAAELRKRGVTRQLLWEEYRREHPQGYGYTQFCEHLSRHVKKNDAVMHLVHEPGEQMQVDFAGDKLYYIDPDTGEVIYCEVLVCVLPYSHYTFAMALRSQKQEEFIRGISLALEYFGGVPHSIKCDNLRQAVTKSNRYEPQFTEAMEYVADHYHTTILAARVRKPRDKASVEKAVDLSYKYIYAPLRYHSFHSIEEINVAIHNQLEQLNDRLFKGKTYSRRKLFDQEEKLLLRPLPSSRYEIKHVAWGKVQRNYHVIVGEDYHQYSVPFTLIGRRLKLVYTTDTVEIYDEAKRVAIHIRSYRKHGYSTLAEHMPEGHRHMVARKGWNAEYFEKQAEAIGSATVGVIKKILESRFFYEQTYNSCLGILRLGKKYTDQRLEAACKRALHSPIVNYRTVENILKNHLDKQSLLFSEDQITTPDHDQLRGPSVYQ